MKKNHFYRTVDEAIEAYNRFADIVVRQEAEFLLTPTERQAIRLWRRHREKRMQEGKKSQTLEEAIRYAMDAEHKQDIARRTIEDLFHEYSLYKEKEAETKKGRYRRQAMSAQPGRYEKDVGFIRCYLH